jgi:hypothetical protein
MNNTDLSTHYQICLEGILDERWLRWFEGLEVKINDDDQTIIQGVFDQSALHGLLNRIRDLGVTIISVQRHPDRKESLYRSSPF